MKPMAIDELAVKRIVRYLYATKNKGLIMHPSTNQTLDMYVDANFTGMLQKEHTYHCNDVSILITTW
jgi:hypothetical protein